MTVLRAFVALWPPADLVDELALRAAAAAKTREGRDLRLTAPHRLHLTCVFLGDVLTSHLGELADRLEVVAANATAQRLSIARAGHFGDRVLWAAPADPVDGLKSLAKAIRVATREAGLAVQGNEFVPHVTVARTREAAVLAPSAARLSESLLHDPLSWTADDLCLVSSVRGSAPAYGVLERWPLPPDLRA